MLCFTLLCLCLFSLLIGLLGLFVSSEISRTQEHFLQKFLQVQDGLEGIAEKLTVAKEQLVNFKWEEIKDKIISQQHQLEIVVTNQTHAVATTLEELKTTQKEAVTEEDPATQERILKLEKLTQLIEEIH